MSMMNGDESSGQRPGGDAFCRAEDLRDILQQLAGQIAELDRRHTSTLRDMYDRLADLGGQAEQAKSSLPPVFVPAFERIEESLGQLAERIVEADRQRQYARAPGDEPVTAEPPGLTAGAAPNHANDRHFADLPRDPIADRPAAPVGPEPIPVGLAARTEPAPLRSALSGGATADVVVPRPGQDQWDRESAEALARIYDGGEIQPVRGPAAPHVLGIMPVQAAPAATGVDREWLEERLAAISQGIEASFAGISPERSVEALGMRFDQLEERFAHAIEGVAQRSDVEGLRLVEAHINEMLSQLDHTHAQLERLGTLESQIGDLSKQLSNDAVADLVAQAMPTGDELTSFAETAAERAAERVAERVAQQIVANLPAQPVAPLAAAAPVESERLDRLHGLLETFMDERRRGEEATAGMLDTVQQAVQHLLDRVESLEQGYQQPVVQPHEMAPMSGDGSQYHPQHEQPLAMAGAVAGGSGAQAAHQAGQYGADAAPQGRIEPQFEAEPAHAHAAAARAPEPHAEAAPQASSREDFIAAARRAARQLANEQQEAPAAGAKAKGPRSQPPKGGAAAATAGRNKLAGANGNGSSRPGVLLVACIGALLVTGGFMLYGKHFRNQPTAASSKLERKMLTTETEASDQAAAAKSGEGKGAARPGTPQPPVKQQSGDQDDDVGGAAKKGSQRSAEAPQEGDMPPNIAAILKAQQHQRMATLSQHLGQQSAGGGAAVMAPVSVQAPEAAPEAAVGEMPPAAIGPTSLRVAAQKGDPSAQFEVAARFAEGKGVSQDFAQAMAWYHKSAAQGFGAAQYRIANLYERGLGVTADLPRARAWYKRAADQGHVKAMHNLAVISTNKAAGTPDYATAAEWFKQAAERGLADSQFNLAVLLESGLGVARNPAEAYRWFSIAARNGDREAQKRRDTARSRIPADAARTIDAAVAAWRPSAIDMIVNDPRMAGDAWRRRAVAAPG